MINKVHNAKLNFTSNLRFVNSQEYSRKVHEALERANHRTTFITDGWNVENITLTENGGTDSLSCCVGGGIVEPRKDRMILHHLVPRYVVEDPQSVQEKLETLNEGLSCQVISENSRSKSSLVIGGQSGNERSYKAANHLEKVSASLNTQPTVIVGKKHGGTDVFHETDGDNWYISTYGDDKPVETIDDLKNTYDYISISPKDQLFISNKPVERNLVNQDLINFERFSI